MASPSKQEKQQYIEKLVFYANKIGYGVDFESMQEEFDEGGDQMNPAGLCVTGPDTKMIYVRKGKKPDAVITTLTHEIVHALNQYNRLRYVGLFGRALEEWECESVAHFVTQLIGIDRRAKTEQHVSQYVGEPIFNTSDKVKTIVTSIYNYITENDAVKA